MGTKRTVEKSGNDVVGVYGKAAADINTALTVKPPLTTNDDEGAKKELVALLPEIKEGDKLSPATWKTLKGLGWKNAKVTPESTPAPAKIKAKKTEKVSKVPKAEKAKKEKAEDTRKITLLVKENPKRAGSESAKRFSHYKTGMTVQKALELGVTPGDILWDIAHKFISAK